MSANRKGLISTLFVLSLFLASSFFQLALPLIHASEVDEQECRERSCSGHPKSHVEADRRPSHHDSQSCRVCQLIQSTQPAESQSGDQTVVAIVLAEYVPGDTSESVVCNPSLYNSSPRAPPSLL